MYVDEVDFENSLNKTCAEVRVFEKKDIKNCKLYLVQTKKAWYDDLRLFTPL